MLLFCCFEVLFFLCPFYSDSSLFYYSYTVRSALICVHIISLDEIR